MFLHRMASKPSAHGLISLVIASYAISAAAAFEFRLSKDLTGLIPVCAQSCFLTFLSANYGTDKTGLLDGDFPSLKYLCSTPGDTQFTAGEGAVQCIVAEKSVGGCSSREASSKYPDREPS